VIQVKKRTLGTLQKHLDILAVRHKSGKVNNHRFEPFDVRSKVIPVFLIELLHFFIPFQVSKTYAVPVALHGIGDSYAASGCPYRLFPRGVPLFVNFYIFGQNDMSAVGNKNPAGCIDSPVFKHLYFFEEGFRVDYHSGPQNYHLIRIKDPRRDKMKSVLLVAYYNGMPRVCPA